nr:T9SS type A sorting domain-containing protein [uncultured Carboxylicivirga sp.]
MKKILLLFLLGWSIQSQAADHDLAISRWLLPQSAGDLGDTETVRFEIENLGVIDESNFTVSFSLDGGNSFIEEAYTGTVPAGSKRTHTFTAKADLSIDGATYVIIGKISLTGDEDSSNDEIEVSVVNKIIGDDCDDPFVMDLARGVTYTDTRDITPFGDDYDYNSGWGAPNYLQDREVFYQFQTTAQTSYLDVTLHSNYEGSFAPKVAVHVINACPDGTFSTVSSGYDFNDYNAEVKNAYLYYAQTYYVVVSKWTTYNFTYDLEVTLYEQTDFKSFQFKDITSSTSINYDNHSITVTVPYQTDLENLTPVFEIPNYADVWKNGVIQSSGIEVIDFSSPVLFSVIQNIGTGISQDWTITVTEDIPSNINKTDEEDIMISPNPVYDILNIALNSNGHSITKASIINTAGNLVQEIILSSNKNQINLSNLSPGLYLIKIESNEKQIIKKFVKN